MSINTVKQSKFFKPLHKRSAMVRRPNSVMFELTYRCNFKCPYCYVEGSHKNVKELSSRQVFAIIDQMRDMGVFNIAFTGGEALLRKDIFDILAYAKRQGFQTTLLSNGYLIDKDVADKLLRVNVNNVEITFNSLKPDLFEKLTGAKDSFKKVKSAIRLLINRGINIKIKSIGINLNRDELVSIGKFARSLNIIYNLDTEVLPCRNRGVTAVEDFSLDPDETAELRRAVYPEMFSGNRRTYSNRRRNQMFNCSVGKTSFSITPYGKMNFCLEVEYPECDILKHGVEGCWEKIKREVDRLNDMPDFVCGSCDLIKYCGWCAGRSYIETGKFNRCSEHFKEEAIKAKKRREGEWKRKK